MREREAQLAALAARMNPASPQQPNVIAAAAAASGSTPAAPTPAGGVNSSNQPSAEGSGTNSPLPAETTPVKKEVGEEAGGSESGQVQQIGGPSVSGATASTSSTSPMLSNLLKSKSPQQSSAITSAESGASLSSAGVVPKAETTPVAAGGAAAEVTNPTSAASAATSLGRGAVDKPMSKELEKKFDIKTKGTRLFWIFRFLMIAPFDAVSHFETYLKARILHVYRGNVGSVVEPIFLSPPNIAFNFISLLSKKKILIK